jgi:hypothetical protein
MMERQRYGDCKRRYEMCCSPDRWKACNTARDQKLIEDVSMFELQ